MKKIIILLVMAMTILMCSVEKTEKEEKKNEDKLPQKVIVGLDDTFAPMGFKNEKGELVGFDIELFLLGVGALRKGWGNMATSTAGAVLALAFVVELWLPSLKALLVWPVLLGITALAFVLQVLKLAILNVKDGGARR